MGTFLGERHAQFEGGVHSILPELQVKALEKPGLTLQTPVGCRRYFRLPNITVSVKY